jgi:ATP-dependent DNA ligase
MSAAHAMARAIWFLGTGVCAAPHPSAGPVRQPRSGPSRSIPAVACRPVAAAGDGGRSISAVLEVLPQLVANDGLRVIRAAIAEPTRYAIEPKIDGVRGLIVFRPDGVIETRNRRGQVRDWQRHRAFAVGLRRLAQRLPILWEGTVLDTELVAERFAGTMAALQGSARHGDALRVHVFDVPMLAGVDLRPLPWEQRRERLELLAKAFEDPYRLVPVVDPDASLVGDMEAGILEGIVLKDRRSTYRGGSRAGWSKVKDPSWHTRESWRFAR